MSVLNPRSHKTENTFGFSSSKVVRSKSRSQVETPIFEKTAASPDNSVVEIPGELEDQLRCHEGNDGAGPHAVRGSGSHKELRGAESPGAEAPGHEAHRPPMAQPESTVHLLHVLLVPVPRNRSAAFP